MRLDAQLRIAKIAVAFVYFMLVVGTLIGDFAKDGAQCLGILSPFDVPLFSSGFAFPDGLIQHFQHVLHKDSSYLQQGALGCGDDGA
ncbi:hypothetical protein SDC9_210043 [bioreactor metagenome]|uniref:Uncharacterized protein n=1 Tax=bioreactor metagenome TaxID=1076179 RepID=A0A645JFP5_9ZZZZ